MKDLSDELLREIVQRLVATLHPREIYLFGSQASGKAHRHSDVDLMVVVADDAPDSFELAQLGYPALADLIVPVELHFVRNQNMAKWMSVKFSLPYETTKKGRLIYAAGHAVIQQWLERANADLRMADLAQGESSLIAETGFHCQQAAEKSLKAYLTFHGIEFD